jgi:hypothetical protein
MLTLWDEATQRDLLGRIDRVTDSSKALWGRFTADRMLCHLAESMKMANGEIVCAPKKLPIRFFPLKQLLIFVVPFAKGLPTAPELLASPETPVDAAKSELRAAMQRFIAAGPGAQRNDHPAFGRLTSRAWGVLTARHCDHHLRQFGV